MKFRIIFPSKSQTGIVVDGASYLIPSSNTVFMFDVGKISGQESSSHLHPETERLPRPGRHTEGEMAKFKVYCADRELSFRVLLVVLQLRPVFIFFKNIDQFVCLSAEVQEKSSGIDSDAQRARDFSSYKPHWVPVCQNTCLCL